ncbi:MAG: exosortase system-associated protein, TIGR04073 family [Chthoniobacter sp.]|uniref:exosortase system-associated protein, TIGR04073 family n=1 Tax=Chthoniobacter sp. TaxID=2510640 RepID=UPI0032A4AB26
MKTLLSLVFVSLLSASAFADIQDPPGNDYGPTRKLSRGLANIAFAGVEIIKQPSEVGFYEGDAAAFSYGGVRGFGRFIFRMGAGFWEVFSFPFATNRGTYKPPYRSNIPWIHGGYEEFPPELGFESHYRYSSEQSSVW